MAVFGFGKFRSTETQNRHFKSHTSRKLMYVDLNGLYNNALFVVAFNKVHREIVILRSNQSFLAENMHLREGLLDKLRLSDCLTDVQTRILKRQTVVSGKNKLIIRNNNSELLHVLLSCDDTGRSDCFRCFPHSKQKLFTKVMDNGGGSV